MIDPLHLQAADDESALGVLADRYEESGRLDVAAALRAPGVPWGVLTDGLQRVVTYRAADRACRIYAPLALYAARIDAEASRLEGLAPIVDADSAALMVVKLKQLVWSTPWVAESVRAAVTHARRSAWLASLAITMKSAKSARAAAGSAGSAMESSRAAESESESAEIALQRRDAILILGGDS